MGAGAPVASGVISDDCGIGGRDSRRAAPKLEVGLNGRSPPKPVICGLRGALAPDVEIEDEEDVIVAPVGWDESGVKENRDSEVVVPVVVVIVVPVI